MHNWFKGSIKYEKMAEEGKIIKVVENYIVDALSFTEAEARLIKELKPFVSGELVVSRIRRAKINEMFFNDHGDKWYNCKVYFIALDEEKGVEKKTAVTIFAQASTVKEALEVFANGMQGSMADYELAGITETDIFDVFKYEAPEAEEEPKEETAE